MTNENTFTTVVSGFRNRYDLYRKLDLTISLEPWASDQIVKTIDVLSRVADQNEKSAVASHTFARKAFILGLWTGALIILVLQEVVYPWLSTL